MKKLISVIAMALLLVSCQNFDEESKSTYDLEDLYNEYFNPIAIAKVSDTTTGYDYKYIIDASEDESEVVSVDKPTAVRKAYKERLIKSMIPYLTESEMNSLSSIEGLYILHAHEFISSGLKANGVTINVYSNGSYKPKYIIVCEFVSRYDYGIPSWKLVLIHELCHAFTAGNGHQSMWKAKVREIMDRVCENNPSIDKENAINYILAGQGSQRCVMESEEYGCTDGSGINAGYWE